MIAMINDVCRSIYEFHRQDIPVVGKIVWYPVGYLEQNPRILDVERASPTDHNDARYEIVQIGRGHYRDRGRLPVHGLNLGYTEELLIARSKKRPCIIVSVKNSEIHDFMKIPEIARRPHLWDNAVTLAPMYSIDAAIGTSSKSHGIPHVMIDRIKLFQYNQFMYLPAKCTSSGVDLKQDHVIRIDRLFSALLSPVAVEFKQYKLSKESLNILHEVIKEHSDGVSSEYLEVIRELAMQQY